MRPRGWFLVSSFALAVVFSGISCHDDDYWDDDDFCHHDRNGVWHCHDDDDFHHVRGQTDGVVIVLITDQPAEDISAFYVTITEVTLFEAVGRPISVYRSESGRRLDLLSLRDSPGGRLHELLAVRELPSGVYGSIRLTMRDPALVLSSGGRREGPEIELAGGGRIDIDLDEHVLLGPDETVHLILDIDLRATIPPSLLSEGGSVSPVVLVDVLYSDFEEEVRTRTGVDGLLRELDAERGLFRLELPEEQGAIEVRVRDDVEILDRALAPAPRSLLRAESRVAALGTLSSIGVLDIERIALDPDPGRTPAPGEVPAVSLHAPLAGAVAGVTPEGRTLLVDVDGTRRAIALSSETAIISVEVSEDRLRQTSVPLRGIEIGANVTIHGDADSPARVVIIAAHD